ncbi:hypothetical protein FNF29_00119 [Cafeteria roenbergensis]|uniref:Uncharacterized protein n=1 Tax=Cafeteria roenbergensis TaxID=33653 RepID=A0A5A8CWK0_CAFRO|nr:hypothetical protein FNF29_00119 [Cafeteria roenbergensis]|eukprot:KAA0157543.1 hypothetical protein FNF29_00119 [Cafeteria roenbergensis]
MRVVRRLPTWLLTASCVCFAVLILAELSLLWSIQQHHTTATGVMGGDGRPPPALGITADDVLVVQDGSHQPTAAAARSLGVTVHQKPIGRLRGDGAMRIAQHYGLAEGVESGLAKATLGSLDAVS